LLAVPLAADHHNRDTSFASNVEAYLSGTTAH
jgi:hypothetical protein